MDNVKDETRWILNNKIVNQVFLVITVLIIFLGIMYKSYSIFHILVETVCVIMAFIFLSIYLSTYNVNPKNIIVILGIAYGFIGYIGLIYIFAYRGMSFLGNEYGNITKQLWLIRRYIEVVSFIIALKLKEKPINTKKILFNYFWITSILIFLVFLGVFPDCCSSEYGFTLFNIINKFIILGLTVLSIVYVLKDNRINREINFFFLLALFFSAFSEIFFLFDIEADDYMNAISQIFRFGSFYFMYIAFVRTSLHEPYIALHSLNQQLLEKNRQLKKLIDEFQKESKYRRRIERENFRKRQILNEVLESTIDGIMVVDNNKNILHINSQFIEMFNIPIEVAFSQDVNRIMKHIKNATKEIVDFDFYSIESLKLKGQYTSYLRLMDNRIFEVASLPYIDNGEKAGIVINCRDITDRERVKELKKNIELRKELLKKAKEIDDMKTSFFNTISHEIRTPLNIIVGEIQLLEYDKKKNKNGEYILSENSVKALLKNSYRLIKLADNLIDITRIDSGYMHLNLLNHNIVKVVKDATYSVIDYIKGTDIYISFKTDLDERIMACDAQKIERVMLNLISNAIKFSKSKVCILVSIENRENAVVIKVKDNGIGIPSNMTEQIFDRLKQVDTSLRRANEGTGIGLYIVKSIVEMHGGSISVNSKVGEGSEFIIQLPVYIIQEENRQVYLNTYMGIDRVKIEMSDIYRIN